MFLLNFTMSLSCAANSRVGNSQRFGCRAWGGSLAGMLESSHTLNLLFPPVELISVCILERSLGELQA